MKEMWIFITSIKTSLFFIGVIVKGKEFLRFRIFAHPRTLRNLCGYGVAVWLLACTSPRLSYSCILGTINFPTVEICRHGVDSLLIHVVLVNLHWVPVIKIVLAVSVLEPKNVPIWYHRCCVHHPRIYSICWALLGSKTPWFSSMTLHAGIA